ncbi:hypothetical protein [[Acholeplasma] multilocale]|uniref:hypothetical protein n=1 Tax=[Acholeplasma] multilocale TaxID=264638 RepID=UPI00047C0DCF|nr:hypothetical protein [[Acholeplasma] multilocale]
MNINDNLKLAKQMAVDTFNDLNEFFYTTTDNNMAYNVKNGPLFTFEHIIKGFTQLEEENFTGDWFYQINIIVNDAISLENEAMLKAGAPQGAINQAITTRTQGIQMYKQALKENGFK